MGSTWLSTVPFPLPSFSLFRIRDCTPNNTQLIVPRLAVKLAHTAIIEYHRWSDLNTQIFLIILEVHDKVSAGLIFPQAPLLDLQTAAFSPWACTPDVLILCSNFLFSWGHLDWIRAHPNEPILISFAMTSLQIHLHSLVLGIGGFNIRILKRYTLVHNNNGIWNFLQKQGVVQNLGPRYTVENRIHGIMSEKKRRK